MNELNWFKKNTNSYWQLMARGLLLLILFCSSVLAHTDSLKNIPNRSEQVSVTGLDKKNHDYLSPSNVETHRQLTFWHSYVHYLSTSSLSILIYLLILLGIYGVFFELIHPGLVLPGILGIIFLLGASYISYYSTISYTGLALIILGMICIIVQGFYAAHQLLSIFGTGLFVLGSIIFINQNAVFNYLVWSIISTMALLNILVFIWLLNMVLNLRQLKPKNGLNTLVGAQGQTLTPVSSTMGQAKIKGEIWQVFSKSPIAAQEFITVVKVNGLVLEIEKEWPVVVQKNNY